MTIYYTAKDIEDMAAKGIRQLEIGPGITLTDFARETAQQLDITLVTPGRKAARSGQPAAAIRPTKSSSKYNKPSGCMHGGSGNTLPPASSPAAVPTGHSNDDGNANTVNRLIDLMGKAIKRGG